MATQRRNGHATGNDKAYECLEHAQEAHASQDQNPRKGPKPEAHRGAMGVGNVHQSKILTQAPQTKLIASAKQSVHAGPDPGSLESSASPPRQGLGSFAILGSVDKADAEPSSPQTPPSAEESTTKTTDSAPSREQPLDQLDDDLACYTFIRYHGRSPASGTDTASSHAFSNKAQYTFAAEFQQAWLASERREGRRRDAYGVQIAAEWRRGHTPHEAKLVAGFRRA